MTEQEPSIYSPKQILWLRCQKKKDGWGNCHPRKLHPHLNYQLASPCFSHPKRDCSMRAEPSHLPNVTPTQLTGELKVQAVRALPIMVSHLKKSKYIYLFEEKNRNHIVNFSLHLHRLYYFYTTQWHQWPEDHIEQPDDPCWSSSFSLGKERSNRCLLSLLYQIPDSDANCLVYTRGKRDNLCLPLLYTNVYMKPDIQTEA